MKNFNYYLFFFFIFFLNNAHATNKIVFVDIDYLINNSSYGKTIIKKIENEDKKNIEKLKVREASLKKIEDEIKKKQNIISNEELQKEISLLKKKITDFKSEKNTIVKSFTKFKNEELNKILLKFNEIIKDYMTKNSIDIVFDKKSIYIGKSSIDITQNILQEIEKKLNE